MRLYLTGARPAFDVNKTESLEERFNQTGRNTGNQVIAHGLLSRLSYEEVSWDPSLSADEVNEQFDHVVIAAANFLHTTFDFGYLADFLERIRLPISIVGLGAQSNDFAADVSLVSGTERLLAVVAERCQRIGVRGSYTAEVLDRRGIKNVQVTGCPSYYAPRRKVVSNSSIKTDEPLRLVVNASRDVIRHSFDPAAMRAAVDKLMHLAVERGADFVAQTERPEMVIAEGYIEDLHPFVEELGSSFGNSAAPPDLAAWASEHCKVYWKVDEWIAAMMDKDFVIGTRFHGAIAGLLAGTPSMVVCHDTRTTEMCRFLQVPHVDLDGFNQTSIEDLYASLDLHSYHARFRILDSHYREFLKVNGLKPREPA